MNGQVDGQMSRQIGRWAMAWQSRSGAPQPSHREPGLAAGGVQRRDVHHIRLWAYLAPGEVAWRGLPHPQSSSLLHSGSFSPGVSLGSQTCPSNCDQETLRATVLLGAPCSPGHQLSLPSPTGHDIPHLPPPYIYLHPGTEALCN